MKVVKHLLVGIVTGAILGFVYAVVTGDRSIYAVWVLFLLGTAVSAAIEDIREAKRERERF